MLSTLERTGLESKLLGVTVSDTGNPLGRLTGGRARRPRFRFKPDALRRERLVEVAIDEACESGLEHGHAYLFQAVKRRMAAESNASGKMATGFIDPITMFWIIRIAIMVAQYFSDRHDSQLAVRHSYVDYSPPEEADYFVELKELEAKARDGVIYGFNSRANQRTE